MRIAGAIRLRLPRVGGPPRAVLLRPKDGALAYPFAPGGASGPLLTAEVVDAATIELVLCHRRRCDAARAAANTQSKHRLRLSSPLK